MAHVHLHGYIEFTLSNRSRLSRRVFFCWQWSGWLSSLVIAYRLLLIAHSHSVSFHAIRRSWPLPSIQQPIHRFLYVLFSCFSVDCANDLALLIDNQGRRDDVDSRQVFQQVHRCTHPNWEGNLLFRYIVANSGKLLLFIDGRKHEREVPICVLP